MVAGGLVGVAAFALFGGGTAQIASIWGPVGLAFAGCLIGGVLGGWTWWRVEFRCSHANGVA